MSEETKKTAAPEQTEQQPETAPEEKTAAAPEQAAADGCRVRQLPQAFHP